MSSTPKKLPWIPMYHGDWLASTSALTAAEKGVFITLLMLIYDNAGPLVLDHGRLARRCGLSKSGFKKVLTALIELDMIQETDAGLTNERCEIELARRAEISQKRSFAARQKKSPEAGKTIEKQESDSANVMQVQAQPQSHAGARAQRAGAPAGNLKSSAPWGRSLNSVSEISVDEDFSIVDEEKRERLDPEAADQIARPVIEHLEAKLREQNG